MDLKQQRILEQLNAFKGQIEKTTERMLPFIKQQDKELNHSKSLDDLISSIPNIFSQEIQVLQNLSQTDVQNTLLQIDYPNLLLTYCLQLQKKSSCSDFISSSCQENTVQTKTTQFLDQLLETIFNTLESMAHQIQTRLFDPIDQLSFKVPPRVERNTFFNDAQKKNNEISATDLAALIKQFAEKDIPQLIDLSTKYHGAAKIHFNATSLSPLSLSPTPTIPFPKVMSPDTQRDWETQKKNLSYHAMKKKAPLV